MRWILLVVAWVAMAGAADTRPIPGWTGDDLHFVDGYWLAGEWPCAPQGETDCGAGLPEAVRGLLPADAAMVTGASLAGYPTYLVDEKGNADMRISGGLSAPWIVVFDLADGRRKVVTMMCEPEWNGSRYTGATISRRQQFADLRQRGPDPLPPY